MCFRVKNLIFIAGMTIDTALLIKIKSAVRVTNLCNLYKSVGVVNYFFVCFLIKLFHNVFTFTPDNSGIKYFLLVMAFIVIDKLGKSLLVTISFYMHSERWPTITLTSRDSFLFFHLFFIYPLNYFITVYTSITLDPVSLSFTYRTHFQYPLLLLKLTIFTSEV